MTTGHVGAHRVLDVTKVVVAFTAAVLFAGGASRLLAMLVPEPPETVPRMTLAVAVLLTIVSPLVLWSACWSWVRSQSKRADGGGLNPHSVGPGLTALAWLPFLLLPPTLAVLGPTGRLAGYPGGFVVIVAVSVLPAALAASGWARASAVTAVLWLAMVGAAFVTSLSGPDTALAALALGGWTTYGLLAYRRSAPERRARVGRSLALGSELRAVRRLEVEKREEHERRRWQETVRIPAHKGRKGLAVDLDRRRWTVTSTIGGDDDAAVHMGLEVGRLVLEHRGEQEMSPLAVSVEVRRSRGEAASALRVLTGIDDPGAVGPPAPEVHRTRRFGDVLCVLVRVPDNEVSDEQGARSVLTYVWRVGAHVSDVRVRAWSRDEERILATVEDIDALVASVRFL